MSDRNSDGFFGKWILILWIIGLLIPIFDSLIIKIQLDPVREEITELKEILESNECYTYFKSKKSRGADIGLTSVVDGENILTSEEIVSDEGVKGYIGNTKFTYYCGVGEYNFTSYLFIPERNYTNISEDKFNEVYSLAKVKKEYFLKSTPIYRQIVAFQGRF